MSLVANQSAFLHFKKLQKLSFILVTFRQKDPDFEYSTTEFMLPTLSELVRGGSGSK